MIVAIPTETEAGLDSPVAEHFGRAPFFTLIDTSDDSATAVPNGGSHFGGSLYAPEVLQTAGVEQLLCHGLGGKAIAMCQGSGIGICIGQQRTAREMYEAWKRDELKSASDADGCAHENH